MSKEPKRNVYVGHRYVPKIMGEWDKTESYEGLSIVTNKGTSYTSKKRVPVGIDILDEEYWVVTGNYNAQIEEYRKDVRELEKEVGKKSDQSYVDNLNEKVTTQLGQMVTNVKTFGAKGDGVTDDTNAIQEAIDFTHDLGGGTVLIPVGTYLIKSYIEEEITDWYHEHLGGIKLKDNITIEMIGSAELKSMVSNYPHYSIFSLINVNNVTITGGKITGEREEHIGNEGEYGYGVNIRGGSNIAIKNVSISNFWGDGININYLGKIEKTSPKNIIIDNVFCDNNRRQGMSIESGDNISVLNSIFSGTKGTNPQAGIDIEPSNADAKIKNVKLFNCVFRGNNRSGLQVYKIPQSENNVNNIVVDSCLFEDNGGIAQFYSTYDNTTLINSDFSGGDSDIYLRGKNHKIKNNVLNKKIELVSVENCIITDNIIKNDQNEDVFRISNSNDIVINNNVFKNDLEFSPTWYISNVKELYIENNVFKKYKQTLFDIYSNTSSVYIINNKFFDLHATNNNLIRSRGNLYFEGNIIMYSEDVKSSYIFGISGLDVKIFINNNMFYVNEVINNIMMFIYSDDDTPSGTIINNLFIGYSKELVNKKELFLIIDPNKTSQELE